MVGKLLIFFKQIPGENLGLEFNPSESRLFRNLFSNDS